jgi:hypothetical protein
MQAFTDFVDAQETSAGPAQKKAAVVEADDVDDNDLVEKDLEDSEEVEDGDEDNDELDFVNAKEGLDSQQKTTGAIIVEDEDDEGDDDGDDDIYFEDENPGRRALLAGEEEDKGTSVDGEHTKTRALGYYGNRCYWYHGYKRCYYHRNNHYKPSYYYN